MNKVYPIMSLRYDNVDQNQLNIEDSNDRLKRLLALYNVRLGYIKLRLRSRKSLK